MAPRWFVIPLIAFFLLGGLSRHGYSLDGVAEAGTPAVLLCLLGFVCGAAVTPALLPWLPGRAFSVKGTLVGLAAALAYTAYRWPLASTLGTRLGIVAWIMILPAVSAFFAMNFTGASTYTSLSGVKKEVRLTTPALIGAGSIGMALWLVGRFA